MKVAIYVRVSTIEQVDEGYSIPAQINILKDYAASYKYSVTKIYQDAGISGKDIEGRPGLLELIDDASKGKFEMLIIWKLSRLSRSLLDLLSIVDQLNKHDISLISYSEKFDTSTPIGKMLLQLLGSIAEFERNTIIENVKMGMSERFKQGYSKGAIPFGYMHVDKKAMVNKSQAEMVKFAFDYYIKNDNPNCLQYIADYFSQNGHKTRIGGIWNRLTVREMLMNKFYAGYVRTGVKSHGRKNKNYSEFIGMHDPIIDIELYNKVNDKLNSNKSFKSIRNPDNDNVLTGLIICPKCGAKMYALNTYSYYDTKQGTRNNYTIKGYRCINSSKGKQFCPGFNMVASKIEPDIMKLIKEMSDISFLKESIKQSEIELKKLSKPIINNLKLIDKQLLDLYVTKEKYFKMFENSKNINVNFFTDKFNDLDIKITELESRREKELINKPVQIDSVSLKQFKVDLKEFIRVYDKLSNQDKKTLVRSLINEIHISNDKKLQSVKLTNGLIIPYHI